MKVMHVVHSGVRTGLCKLVLDLCRFSERSEPQVFVHERSRFVDDCESLGLFVSIAEELNDRDDPEAAYHDLWESIDLLNIHFFGGPDMNWQVGISQLFEDFPHVFTCHWPSRLPVTGARIICTSRRAADVQWPNNRCDTIFNGTDLQRFRPRDTLRAEAPIVIRVCNPERCAEYFVPAVQRALDAVAGAQLWIVGADGESTDRVRYFGYRDDVDQLLAGADIFAYAPRPGEGTFDLSVLEAMASGVPPVVTDVDSVQDSVTHEQDGLKVPFDDPASLTAAVQRLLVDAEERARLGAAARQTAENSFDIRGVARRYEEVYADVLNSSD
jgi:glycosyltransferase involved in cell wall biosynthesis